MSSSSRGSEGEERGGGGKVGRARRRKVAAPPYARPQNSSPAENGNPKWLSGIISGAGRLISSVFRSESEESSSTSSSEASDGDSDKDDDVNVRTNNLQGLNERNDRLPALCGAEESPWEIQLSERKLVIKQLLTEEIFSRKEGDALIKLIQSRVVDTPDDSKSGERQNVLGKSIYNDLTFLGTWRSINKGRQFPDGWAYSSNLKDECLSEPSSVHAFTEDLCDKAVLEAKQWLGKKKSESASKSATKSDPDLGPCALNSSVWDVEAGSPVDVARTYMRSRPPWQSPMSSGFRFQSPSSRLHLFKDKEHSGIKFDKTSPLSLGSSEHDGALKTNPLPGLVEASKSLHVPITPEYGHADVATNPPEPVAVNANIIVSPREDLKESIDPPSNGAANAESIIFSTNLQVLDSEDCGDRIRGRSTSFPAAAESPSATVPNYILINNQSQNTEPRETKASDEDRHRTALDRRMDLRSYRSSRSPSQPSAAMSGPPSSAAQQNGDGSSPKMTTAARARRVMAKKRRGKPGKK